MFRTLKNAWKTDDLRSKILFTLIIILIYRIGVAIPMPFINADTLTSTMSATNGSIFEYLNILTGSAFSNATLFALGINPYITASIVIQLLCVAIPALEKMQKEGPEGQKKLNQITRYVTIALSFLTAFGYYMMLKNYGVLTNETVFAAFVIIFAYSAGSSIVMWLGERINDEGIGNGISMILFANIVSRLPSIVETLISFFNGSAEDSAGDAIGLAKGISIGAGMVILIFAMVVFIVFINDSERRLPVQYAKKVIGRKMYGGQNSTLPLKLSQNGVMPIIFASSILSIIPTIGMFVNTTEGTFWDSFFNLFDSGSWLYAVLEFVLIIAFAYFYVAISFNPTEVSNNLKKNGGFIPGIRPGKPTADYIAKVLSRITLIGAVFLGIIAVAPLIINIATGSLISGMAFSGSSIIIVVGVVIETARDLEGQLSMRHYKGFLE